MRFNIRVQICMALSIFVCACRYAAKQDTPEKDSLRHVKRDGKFYPVYIPGSTSTDDGQVTHFEFSDFSVYLHNFWVYDSNYGNGEAHYNGDTSQVSVSDQISVDQENFIVVAQRDTLDINQDEHGWLQNIVIQVKSSGDTLHSSYKVYYAFASELDKFLSYDDFYHNPLKPIWRGKTAFREIKEGRNPKDLAGHYFKINPTAYDDFGKTEILRQLNLKDSVVMYVDKPERMVLYPYKQAQCAFTAQSVWLKVEAYNSGKKLTGTKFIVIHLMDYDDD